MLHFSVFRNKVKLEYKGSFVAGTDVAQAINESIVSSDFVIPILSVDYINDDDCMRQFKDSITSKKELIPILLRDFEWSELEELKSFENVLIPKDKNSIVNHISLSGNQDIVYRQIVSSVKDNIFSDKEKAAINISGSKVTNFYKIMSVIVAFISILALVWITASVQTWYISVLFFFIFLCIEALILRHIFFPTQISTYLNKIKKYEQ